MVAAPNTTKFGLCGSEEAKDSETVSYLALLPEAKKAVGEEEPPREGSPQTLSLS